MYSFFKKNKLEKKRGFSLLELLLVVGVLVVISSIGVGSYLNYSKSIEINSFTQTLVFDLKQAQSNSMAGVNGLKWGVHFVNGEDDYYEIFSTSNSYESGETIISKNFLPSSISFSDPTEGSTKDIIFNKISGGTTSSSVVISSQDIKKIVSVSSLGGISSQDFALELLIVAGGGGGVF